MTKIAAVCAFEIDGLWIRAELLGTHRDFVIDGHRARLVFPEAEPATGLHAPLPNASEELGVRSSHLEQPLEAFEVLVLRVLIYFEASFSASSFSDGRRPDKESRDALALTNDATRMAQRFARQHLWPYLEHLRTKYGQYWLGMSTDQAPLREVKLYDLDADQRLPFGSIHMRASLGMKRALTEALTVEQDARAIAEVRRGETPSTPDKLLADARYLIWSDADHKHAVLLAAIACELNVKDVLRRLVAEGSQPLLDLVLANPRDVSMAVVGLFDKGAKAVTGQSLREDDKALYLRLERLFQHRNTFAHRGEQEIEDADMRDDVQAAEEAFDWLRSLIAISSNQ